MNRIAHHARTSADLFARVVRSISGGSEGEYDRTGFMSHAAETHAFGAGFGVGLSASVAGEYRFVGALLAIVFGTDSRPTSTTRIMKDVLTEPHYAIGGLAAGMLLGSRIGAGADN